MSSANQVRCLLGPTTSCCPPLPAQQALGAGRVARCSLSAFPNQYSGYRKASWARKPQDYVSLHEVPKSQRQGDGVCACDIFQIVPLAMSVAL